MIQLKKTTLFCLLTAFVSPLLAQRDTLFWFVAPEISKGTGNFDRPVSFRFSTYEQAATVTVSQPANPAFTPIVLSFGANNTGVLNFPPFFDDVENQPADMVLNKGFRIQATAPISAYYEVVSTLQANPEIFTLKGKNALGTRFFIPFQNLINNSAAFSPAPISAFDVVATEDNTTVTILPTHDLLGHPAGTAFTINLQRGQSYSAQSASRFGVEHPSGSLVTADKPIAITVKDDLMESGALFGGLCNALAGDQIVPVSELGTRYVVQKGFLNTVEPVFIIATDNNTEVMLDSVVQTTLSEGQTAYLIIQPGVHLIESSKPVYAWQISGNGCEVGGALLPSLEACNTARSVRFVRNNNDPFYLILTTKSGAEGNFLVNGSANVVQASDFSPVPGTNQEWVAATVLCSVFEVPQSISSIVQNTSAGFQMGILNGQDFGNGCRLSYFTDNGLFEKLDTLSFCPNDSIVINGVTYTEPGKVEIGVLPGSAGACDTLLAYELVRTVNPSINQLVFLCPEDSLIVGGQVYYAQDTLLNYFLPAQIGCDTMVMLEIRKANQIVREQNIAFCPGDTVWINNTPYTQPGLVSTTIAAQSGCDTILNITLSLADQPSITRVISFCPGETVSILGVPYTQPGTINVVLPAATGCDTLATFILQYLSPNQPSNLQINCPADIFVDVDPDETGIAVTYPDPTAASDCPCPGLSLQRVLGPPSGAVFLLGETDVCFEARDSCNQSITCCFKITVTEVDACDIKTIGCIKYELIKITADAQQRKTYRIRTTNFCNNKLSYMAIQVPNGIVADLPANNTIYTAPSSRPYLVRNPNYSPFYSVRFSSQSDSIAAGLSDVFKYTLPPQADPTYIHVMVRLEPQVYYEAHMNVFNCVVEYEPSPVLTSGNLVSGLQVYPNPNAGWLMVDWSEAVMAPVHIKLYRTDGRLVRSFDTDPNTGWLEMQLPDDYPNGLYLLEFQTLSGERITERFLLQR